MLVINEQIVFDAIQIHEWDLRAILSK